MSMISSLIDELNKSADEWNESNMFELARMCREAADTITELRGALQVASVDYRHLQAENAKLREVAGTMAYCMQAERDCDGCRMNGAAGTIAEPAGCDGLLDLLRELGVI